MTVVLKVDTKTSLHEPIEIEIDGKKLRVKPVTLRSLEKIQTLDHATQAGSIKAIRQALESLLEGDVSPLLDVPLGRVRAIVETLVEKSIKAGIEEKNGSGPGGN